MSHVYLSPQSLTPSLGKLWDIGVFWLRSRSPQSQRYPFFTDPPVTI
ncbi:hypothetical protein [Cellvibrio sp. NN19]|nr:hypothetical protein [Cellvibrio sp. NN19]